MQRGDSLARLPASILKQLSAIAKDRTEKIKSMGTPVQDTQVLIKANDQTGMYYMLYDDAIRSFLIAGYSENTAQKHINTWKDYDLADVWYLDKYKIIGFNVAEIERLIV